MTYSELADLIFPDAKDFKYYEEKYPNRLLDDNAIVTRVAPSPTGEVHIGTIYQALIAKKVANQSNGVFFVRIEDTDQKREVENGVDNIVSSLKDFNLEPDEGRISTTEDKGNYGPYLQSLRKEIYQSYAKYLLSIGKAYPCFCTQEEKEETSRIQEAAKVRPGYYGNWAKCRNLSLDEQVAKIKDGVPFVIRFRSPGREDRKIKHKDVIKGNVVFPENDQDIVIIKSDGLPTYHFAHAVDDHLMHTTHVIRGDEWLSSVPLHLQLFTELGFTPPKYCHIAPIMKNDNGNKRKLSKRKDFEASAKSYVEMGIPSEAVNEYLLNIANSNFENWRRQNKTLPITDFNLELSKMSVSGALLDLTKMLDVSKNTISLMSSETIYDLAFKWADRFDQKLFGLLRDYKDKCLQIIGIERGTAKPRKDIAKWNELYDSLIYLFDEKFLNEDVSYEYMQINDKEKIKQILTTYLEKYLTLDDKQSWFDNIKQLSEDLGYAKEVKEFKANPGKYPAHVGDVSTVLRIALTGRANTPDMFEIMSILGKDSIEKRFQKAIEALDV